MYVYKIKNHKDKKFILDTTSSFEINLSKDKNKTILVYDDNFIKFYLYQKFIYKLKKIIEDSTGEDGDTTIYKIDNFEKYILKIYKKYFSIDELKNMLKKLYLIKDKFINNYTYQNIDIISNFKLR